MGSTLSIYVIKTLVMFNKSNKMQYQFKEWCSTQYRIAPPWIVQHIEVWLWMKCTRMGSFLFFTQESIKTILSRAKRSKRYKEDTREINQINPWARNKEILTNVNMINKFPTTNFHLSKTRNVWRYLSGGRWQKFIHNHIHKT